MVEDEEISIKRGNYTQIANRVQEAVPLAPFTAAQIKIIHVLIRLTYGWGESTVRISTADLAERTGMSPVGGFRRALADLIDHNVIWQLDEPVGRRPALYQLNKNFDTWREPYRIEFDQLRRLYSKKFERDDSKALSRKDALQGHTTKRATKPSNRRSLTREGHTIEERSVHPAGELPEKVSNPVGNLVLPERVMEGGRNSIFDETLQRPKERKKVSTVVSTDLFPSQASVVVPAKADAAAASRVDPVEPEAQRAMLVQIATAAYHAITAKWGEQPRPIPFGTGSQLAADIVRAGVSAETVDASIRRVVEKKRDEPPRTLEYFRNGIFESHEAATERAIVTAAGHRGPGAPTPISSLLERRSQADKDRRDAEVLADQYNTARRSAAEAWANDPANAGALRIIAVKSKLEMGADAEGTVGEMALAATVRLACAKRAGFPEFDVWRAQPPPEQEPAEVVPNPGVTLPAR